MIYYKFFAKKKYYVDFIFYFLMFNKNKILQ